MLISLNVPVENRQLACKDFLPSPLNLVPAQVVFISLKSVQPFTPKQRKMSTQESDRLGIDLTPFQRGRRELKYVRFPRAAFPLNIPRRLGNWAVKFEITPDTPVSFSGCGPIHHSP